jgi:hypothetical protein
MTYVVYDIETVQADGINDLLATRDYEPDARLKDPLKIEQSILAKRQKDFDKAALYWWTGKIICISTKVLGLPDFKTKTFFGDDEKKLLRAFFDYLAEIAEHSLHPVSIIGKSSADFDIPYTIGRAIVHDIGIPECLRPFRRINDVDQIFGATAASAQRTSLANYAYALNLSGKLGRGDQVSGWYLQTRMGDATAWKTITDYCAGDTDIAAEILTRWLKPYIPTTMPSPSNKLDIPF